MQKVAVPCALQARRVHRCPFAHDETACGAREHGGASAKREVVCAACGAASNAPAAVGARARHGELDAHVLLQLRLAVAAARLHLGALKRLCARHAHTPTHDPGVAPHGGPHAARRLRPSRKFEREFPCSPGGGAATSGPEAGGGDAARRRACLPASLRLTCGCAGGTPDLGGLQQLGGAAQRHVVGRQVRVAQPLTLGLGSPGVSSCAMQHAQQAVGFSPRCDATSQLCSSTPRVWSASERILSAPDGVLVRDDGVVLQLLLLLWRNHLLRRLPGRPGALGRVRRPRRRRGRGAALPPLRRRLCRR